MPRRSNNRFEVNGDTITIMRDGWDELAFATYREDYFDELSMIRTILLLFSMQKLFSPSMSQVVVSRSPICVTVIYENMRLLFLN